MLILLLLYLTGNTLSGQGQKLFTLQEIFLDQRYTPGPPGISDWMPDGNGYINTSPSTDKIYIKKVSQLRC